MEHASSRALKGLQRGVTWFSPRWKAAFFQGPMGLVPIVGSGTAPCITWHQKMFLAGFNTLRASGINFIPQGEEGKGREGPPAHSKLRLCAGGQQHIPR